MIPMIAVYIALLFFSLFIVKLLLWPVRGQKWWLALCFVLASAALYAVAGTPRFAWEQAQRAQAHDAAVMRIHTLQAQLAKQPDDARLWAELGEAYLQTGRPGFAMHAFQRQALLSNGAPEALLNYGRAQVLAANGEVTDKAAETFRMALLQKDDAQARLFLAIHAAHHGQKAKAEAEFKKLEETTDTPAAVKAAATEQRQALESN